MKLIKMFVTDDVKNIVDIEVGTHKGKYQTICPLCNSTRTKQKNQKCFTVYNDIDEVTAYCHHCNKKLVEYKPLDALPQRTEPIRRTKQKQKKRSRLNDQRAIDGKVLKYFESRCINTGVLEKYKIHSVNNEWMPKSGKKRTAIAFPHLFEGELYMIHYRDAAKDFKMSKDPEMILWNMDCLVGAKECVITEGRIDALSFITAGFENAVSVPNGASKNTSYLDDYMYLFEDIEKIYIAVDDDQAGNEFKHELVRRFGFEKCFIVTYQGCKDANQLLCKEDSDSLIKCLNDAKLMDVEGVFRLEDVEDELDNVFKNGLQRGAIIGHDNLDVLISWILGKVGVMTGVPNHGKSEMIDEICTRLNNLYGWKIGLFSPENRPFYLHIIKLIEKYTGKKFVDSTNPNKDSLSFFSKLLDTTINGIEDFINLCSNFIMPDKLYSRAKKHVNNNFFYASPTKKIKLNTTDAVIDDFNIDNVLEKILYLIKAHGIKVAVIDPWNRLEDSKPAGMSDTEFVGRMLIKIISFAQIYNILILIVAHPRKMNKDANGIFERPTPYDISGSANFYNMMDYCMCTYRDMYTDNVEFHVQKIKFKHLGKLGVAHFKYNTVNGRYTPFYPDPENIGDGYTDPPNYNPFDCLEYNEIEEVEEVDYEDQFWNNSSQEPLPF